MNDVDEPYADPPDADQAEAGDNANTAELRLLALRGMPSVQPGDDLCRLIVDGLERSGETLRDGDVLVLAQKIVSKAEGRLVDLATVEPSERAMALAGEAQKDPRLVELILRESNEVLRCRRGVIIVEHRLGFVMASAGIDQSNVMQRRGAAEGAGTALLLPVHPDKSCNDLRKQLRHASGADVAVVIIDSHGRAWRNGAVGVAIGVAGMPALLDLRGTPDMYGRTLQVTEIGLADELAAAASLIMGQAGEGRPVVLARGVPYARRDGNARELVRARELDLFR